MVEYMLNVWRETAEIIIDEFGVIVKMPNEGIKTFVELDEAVNYLWQRGFRY